MRKTIVFAAGASGGHLLPAIAVANEIRKRNPDCRIVFVGAGRDLEKKLIADTPYELRTIPFRGFLGRGVMAKLKLMLSLPVALFRGLKLMSELTPSAVLGFGAYPSIIPVVSAYLLRIPRMIYQQDVQAGLANRALSLISTEVFGPPGARGFPQSVAVRTVGVPVREAFYSLPPYAPPVEGALAKVLVLGGSQGATAINEAVVQALPFLSHLPIEIHHQTGAADADHVRQRYSEFPAILATVEPFIEDVASALSRAHLVISRAGVGSTVEIVAGARPAIFIPLPGSGGHQRHNVEKLAAAGAAIIIDQVAGYEEQLREELLRLLPASEQLSAIALKLQPFREALLAQRPAQILADGASRIMAASETTRQ